MENPRIGELERSIAVVPGSGWALLGGIAALVGGAILWSFAGTIPTKVAGSCILMSAAGMAEVAAPAAGRIAEVPVRPGEQVRAGQTVATIAQPDLEERIRRVRARVAELEGRVGLVASLSRRGLTLSDDALAQRRDFLQQQLELARSRVRIGEDQVATSTQLLEQGLVTRRTVEDTARELRAAGATVRDLERQVADVSRGRAEVVKRERDEMAVAELELSEARRELASAEGEQKRSTAVTSAFDGRVIEVRAGRGMLVAKDAPVVSLERSAAGGGSGVEVVMFVAAGDGKKIRPGAEVHIVPATVKREEKGYFFGTVRYVSDYPATPHSLLATLGNEELVHDLANVAAPFEIRIDPQRGASGYVWSRAGGEAVPLNAGTVCSGEVVVRRERPAGFVIPALRKETR